jgi:hypothetical protein
MRGVGRGSDPPAALAGAIDGNSAVLGGSSFSAQLWTGMLVPIRADNAQDKEAFGTAHNPDAFYF